MNYIETKDLKYDYEIYNSQKDETEKLSALNGINLKIEKGSFVAILGHNGSGKSTFAKHLNCLLTPSEGVVYVNGLDTSLEENVWEIRQNTGMVFQNPDNQIVATIVEEDVAFGPENLGYDSETICKYVENSLKSVGMYSFKDKSPYQLSGGQKQRVAIAGTLAMKPNCIVLDEPTAMLDPIGRQEVMNTVLKLNKEENITIILITHFMEEAVLADRVVIMDDGRVVMDDEPRNVFQNVDKIEKLYLEAPQCVKIATQLGIKNILTNEELADELVKIGFKDNKVVFNEVIKKNKNKEIKIKVEGLTHTYSPDTIFQNTAIKNINFEIFNGEFIALIGHTGSGKSTLIQHFNGLLKPQEGSIFIDGEDIVNSNVDLKKIRQKVGLVFQYPEHQLFESTVFKDVAFGPNNLGLDEDEINNRVTESLRFVGLGEKHYNKSPFELSGGQKRRVAIAGVLAMKPEILILDEPTAGLDPKGREDILSSIKKINDELGITVILVSHSMEDVSRVADRILVLNKGSVEIMADKHTIFSNPGRLKEIGLSAPQVCNILNLLKEKDVEIENEDYDVLNAITAFRKWLNK